MLARKQILAAEKLEKMAFKSYNIKAFWQYNCNPSLNFKANTFVFELVESLKLALDKEKNFAYLFFDII